MNVTSTSITGVRLICLLLALTGCSTAYQGVEGRITTPAGALAKKQVLVTISLADDELAKNANGLYQKPPEKLVLKKTTTDGNGMYKIGVQPGVYSLLIETPQGWYATPSDTNRVLNRVKVLRKQVVNKDITIK